MIGYVQLTRIRTDVAVEGERGPVHHPWWIRVDLIERVAPDFPTNARGDILAGAAPNGSQIFSGGEKFRVAETPEQVFETIGSLVAHMQKGSPA